MAYYDRYYTDTPQRYPHNAYHYRWKRYCIAYNMMLIFDNSGTAYIDYGFDSCMCFRYAFLMFCTVVLGIGLPVSAENFLTAGMTPYSIA